jgi:hypothetical protein
MKVPDPQPRSAHRVGAKFSAKPRMGMLAWGMLAWGMLGEASHWEGLQPIVFFVYI